MRVRAIFRCMAKHTNDSGDQVLAVGGALADRGRLRILAACRGRELCVCQIVELLGLAFSTVSRHLALLRQAGLLRSRKQGRWGYYRLPTPEEASPLVADVLALLERHVASDDLLCRDRSRLDAILKMDPEDLCCNLRESSACCSSAPETPAEARWPKAGPATSRPKHSKRTRRVSPHRD